MSNNLGKYGGIVIAVVTAMAVRYGIDYYRHSDAYVSKTSQSALRDIQEAGTKKHPELSLTEASRQEGLDVSKNTLSGEVDAGRKRTIAAQQFYGFYFVNVRARTDYCREQGVDLTPFTSAFVSEHESELAKARIFAKLQYSEDHFYELVSGSLKTAAMQDIADIAAGNKTSVKGACELVRAGGADLAQTMNIEKINPDLYRVLMTPP